jgi:hypothetical protein
VGGTRALLNLVRVPLSLGLKCLVWEKGGMDMVLMGMDVVQPEMVSSLEKRIGSRRMEHEFLMVHLLEKINRFQIIPIFLLCRLFQRWLRMRPGTCWGNMQR